jgi:hypothetical protein
MPVAEITASEITHMKSEMLALEGFTICGNFLFLTGALFG